jgi:hypothetical protein
MAVWYSLWSIGMYLYFSRFGIFGQRKIWQRYLGRRGGQGDRIGRIFANWAIVFFW